MKKAKQLIVAVCMLSIFNGCGGGGGGGSTTTPTTPLSTLTGTVEDGPIKNARVFVDLNFDGNYTVGEPYDITDENGYYKIEHIFDNIKEYLVIAEGSSDLNTSDEKDNAGEQLDFMMFGTFGTGGTSTSTTIVGQTYTKDLNAFTLKSTLEKIDEDSFGSLSASDANISNYLNDTEENNNTQVFQSFVKDKKMVIQDALKDIAGLIKIQNDERESLATKDDINLDSKTVLTTNTTNSLLENMTIQGSNIGGYSFSKTLDIATKDSVNNYTSFITAYENILQIPQFSTLQDQNNTFMMGADITVKLNGINQNDINNSAILDNLLDKINIANDSNLSLYQYSSSLWNLIDDDFNITTQIIPDDIKNKMILNPFVIVKNTPHIQKTIDVSAYKSYTTPLLVVKNSLGEVIDVVDINNSDSATINYDQNDIIGTVTILSQDFKEITLDKSLAMNINIGSEDNTTISLGEVQATQYIPIQGDSKDDIVIGNNIYGIYGLKSMVRTDIAYSIIDDANNESYTTVDLDSNTTRVSFKKSVSFKESYDTNSTINSNYDQIEVATYTGTVTFNKTTKDLLNARYSQNLTLTNSLSGTNKLNGYIDIQSDDSFTFEKGVFSFTIDNESLGYTGYDLNTTNCIIHINDEDSIDGRVTITDGSSSMPLDPNKTKANNTISSAVVTTSNKCAQ